MNTEQFANLQVGDRVIYGWHVGRHAAVESVSNTGVVVRLDTGDRVSVDDATLLAYEH